MPTAIMAIGAWIILFLLLYFLTLIWGTYMSFGAAFEQGGGACVFWAFLFTAVFGMVGGQIHDKHLEYVQAKDTQPIVALKSKDDIRGSFLFGCGSFGAYTKYRVYVKEKDGAYYAKDFDTKNVGIIEDATPKNACLETHTLVRVSKKRWTNLFFPTSERKEIEVLRRLVHVPPGTVIQEYRVE